MSDTSSSGSMPGLASAASDSSDDPLDANACVADTASNYDSDDNADANEYVGLSNNAAGIQVALGGAHRLEAMRRNLTTLNELPMRGENIAFLWVRLTYLLWCRCDRR